MFTNEKDAVAAIKRKEIHAGDVIVLAGIGPMGTGMEETYQVTSALKYLPFGKDVALITATIPRERIVLAQTPQVFATKLLKEAFARAQADGVNASDEAGLVERMGHDVHVVLGSERNMKITKPADMELARFYLERERKKA